MSNVYDHEPVTTGGLYFKPETDKQYSLKVCTEPVIFDNVFDDPNKGPQISTKYAWVVYNLTDGVAQVLQLPGGAYKQVKSIAMNAKWGEPTNGKYDIAYTKTGSMKDTKHSIVPEPSDGPLTDEQAEEASKIDLIAAIQAGKGTERVQWLKDFGTKEPAAKPQTIVDDVKEVTDDPIRLEDIPY